MYIHVHTFLKIYVHVCTWYVHGMYKASYKRLCTSFRHVCTRLQVYVLILDYINMYVQCTNVYIDCYGAHVECTARLIHFMKCTDIAEPGTYTAELGTIWKPQKVLTWYIPGIYLVYTFRLCNPGIYQVYDRNFFGGESIFVYH